MSFLNLSSVKTDKKFEVLKPGKYRFKCQDVSLHNTKAGTGRYIKAKLREESSGTILFHNFNIENPNQKAVDIGLGQLKSFLRGAGYHNPDELQSLQDLIGLSCMAKTKVKSDEQYGDSAEISYFVDSNEDQQSNDGLPF